MRYAIAIWNFVEEGTRLPDLIGEFADFGFDCISFTARQVTNADEGQVREAVAAMVERDLTATIHCSFDLTREELGVLVEASRERLLCLTFDPAVTEDSRGRLFDAPRMVRSLRWVEELTRGTEARFGVEDFPLDGEALQFYQGDLDPVLTCERYGMLLDLGHLNMRTQQQPYFQQRSVVANLTRTPLPIIEAHVHDNNGQRDEHGHLGMGNAPFEELARGLQRAGFEGVSTIEIAPSFHGSTPAESKPRAKESLDRWRELWESTQRADGGESPRSDPGTEMWVGG